MDVSDLDARPAPSFALLQFATIPAKLWAMPLKPGAPVGDTIREFKSGQTYARTTKKFGAAKAHKQAVAVALANRRKGGKRGQ